MKNTPLAGACPLPVGKNGSQPAPRHLQPEPLLEALLHRYDPGPEIPGVFHRSARRVEDHGLGGGRRVRLPPGQPGSVRVPPLGEAHEGGHHEAHAPHVAREAWRQRRRLPAGGRHGQPGAEPARQVPCVEGGRRCRRRVVAVEAVHVRPAVGALAVPDGEDRGVVGEVRHQGVPASLAGLRSGAGARAELQGILPGDAQRRPVGAPRAKPGHNAQVIAEAAQDLVPASRHAPERHLRTLLVDRAVAHLKRV
mmetsp:Transcript_103861/g.294229  ORF Transcript_103861/g.294229 Transcript_103861/m.294229 type:complete len:252 (-) Transcript_103861:1111-1866(-)